MVAQRHAGHAQFFLQFAGGGQRVALVRLHHAAGGRVPVAGVERLAQGAPVHAQLTGAVEQQDEAAAADQPALAQFGAQ
ncbi:hypothetical protein D9M71_652770 [compost metagenome]